MTHKENLQAAIDNKDYVLASKLFSDRRKSTKEFLDNLTLDGVEVSSYELSLTNWYNIKVDGNYVSSSFFWKDGEYDENGEHSLFDDNGYPKK
jgi:hypothetical protein